MIKDVMKLKNIFYVIPIQLIYSQCFVNRSEYKYNLILLIDSVCSKTSTRHLIKIKTDRYEPIIIFDLITFFLITLLNTYIITNDYKTKLITHVLHRCALLDPCRIVNNSNILICPPILCFKLVNFNLYFLKCSLL